MKVRIALSLLGWMGSLTAWLVGTLLVSPGLGQEGTDKAGKHEETHNASRTMRIYRVLLQKTQVADHCHSPSSSSSSSLPTRLNLFSTLVEGTEYR
ncbi:hypothetical protein BDV40DRAFT_3437 [Aspergillus tamarii]|uniref:Uncharacterized protein n=1 Tax=Aspergillus tamarii TaxID=41984 RepID=A0A5N6V5U2_ASPTM|nr:hypothetical protein BDV40DRAFT_3437 [Aspergillus tamarii]